MFRTMLGCWGIVGELQAITVFPRTPGVDEWISNTGVVDTSRIIRLSSFLEAQGLAQGFGVWIKCRRDEKDLVSVAPVWFLCDLKVTAQLRWGPDGARMVVGQGPLAGSHGMGAK